MASLCKFVFQFGIFPLFLTHRRHFIRPPESFPYDDERGCAYTSLSPVPTTKIFTLASTPETINVLCKNNAGRVSKKKAQFVDAQHMRPPFYDTKPLPFYFLTSSFLFLFYQLFRFYSNSCTLILCLDSFVCLHVFYIMP